MLPANRSVRRRIDFGIAETRKTSGSHRRITIDAMDRQQDVIRRITAHVVGYRFQLENERHERKRDMSRLTEKLELARGVVGRVSATIEAKADEVIAREEVIARRIQEAFAGHE